MAAVAARVKAGRAGTERGRLAEQRTLRAAQRIRAWWFLEARHGTERQDKLGFDLIIETVDLGRIIVQVKSSQRAARAFVRHGKKLALKARIHVLVVEPAVDDATLFGRLLALCILAREEAQAAGLTADDPRLGRETKKTT